MNDTGSVPIFQQGQRVRIKPCMNYPGKNPHTVRYGIIQGLTNTQGMWLINEQRTNDQGEWAYVVASWASPNAGALWFSAAGLELMKREKHAEPLIAALRKANAIP